MVFCLASEESVCGEIFRKSVNKISTTETLKRERSKLDECFEPNINALIANSMARIVNR